MAEETNLNTALEETPPTQVEQEAPAKPAQKTASEEDPSITEENISVARSAPDVVVEHLHSTTVPEATDIPTANAPDPKAANPEVNPNASRLKGTEGLSTPDKPAKTKPSAKETTAKATKETKQKAPAVEDKPFAEFIGQDYLPALKQALQNQGIPDIDLAFEKQKIPISGFNQAEDCWQVIGRWQQSQYQFSVYFPKADIQQTKAFSCAAYSTHPSTLEPFLIDERRVSLDLLVFGVVQRLNGQKWLGKN